MAPASEVGDFRPELESRLPRLPRLYGVLNCEMASLDAVDTTYALTEDYGVCIAKGTIVESFRADF